MSIQEFKKTLNFSFICTLTYSNINGLIKYLSHSLSKFTMTPFSVNRNSDEPPDSRWQKGEFGHEDMNLDRVGEARTVEKIYK